MQTTGKVKQGRERVNLGAFALLGLVALLSIILVVPLGHAAAVIYTDSTDYHPEQVVTIYGSGFTPGTNITISVTRPDGEVNTCADNPTRLNPCPLIADSSGSFIAYYQLDGVTGAYSVVATDGTTFASTAFTDAVSINILGTDSMQHSSQTNEENLGYVGPSALDKFISVKANGLGTGNTLSWNLVYVASAENDTILFPLTTLSPASGTLTKSSSTVSVEVKITTSSLAAGTYRGDLEATGSGVSPTPTPGFYFFKFTLDKTAPVITPSTSPSPNSNGWNNGNVTVTWSVSDPESGILSSSGCGTTTLTAETPGTTITCTATNGAGTSNSVTVTLKIDKTRPTITGSTSPSPNVNGWNNGPVTVSFTCSDALSGVASKTGPTTLTGAGASQSVTGVCTDNAGNTASTTVSSINIDLTPPNITGSRTPNANSFGWNNGPVTVSFTCSDSLSGVASVSGSSTLTGEGAGQSVTGSCTDKAGNSASATVGGINIDMTPPTVSGSRSPGANANGWNNSPVTISFTCTDSLSGVSSISSPTTLSAEGAGQSVTGTCTDKAGNSASTTTGSVNIDLFVPVVAGSPAPAANGNGWNNGDVTVTFTCTDGLSGVDVSPLSPQVVSSEGASQSRTGTCVDKAGNSASATVSGINIDKTSPSISGSRSPAANVYGWNNVTVTVTFTCIDSLSGVAAGPSSPQIVSAEGAVQSRSATCQDRAGNSATATVSDINIDVTTPAITGSRSLPPNVNGWNNVQVTVSFTCSDALSGTASVSGPTTLGEGSIQSVTGACTDQAGNSASTTVGLVNIDLTIPVITSSRSVAPNAKGWNNVPITVSFSCSDALSGVFSVSSPTTLGEGGAQSVTGTCVDLAGNVAIASETGINVDLTPPVVTGSRSPDANVNGWNNALVTVSFTCTDALSGVESSSAPTVLGEGASQSVTGVCVDNAGNSASATVAGINVDLTPPVITSSRSVSPNVNSWNNIPVTVSFACSDALSGVLSVSSPTTLGEGASQSVTGTCVDLAGNSASASETGINIDLTPPVITSSRSVQPNANGWNNAPVTVSFACSDALSGVFSVSSPSTLGEGAAQSVTGICVDMAGNSASAAVGGINVDLTPPVITGSRSPDANANGWNNAPVTVLFTCTDALSGVESSSAPTVLGEGASQSVNGTCVDLSGNSASATVSNINIDLTPPVITSSRSVAPNINGWNDVPVTVGFSCSDALSGVFSLSSVTTLGEGASQSVTGTCVDLAGNTASTTESAINIDLTPPVITSSRSVQPNLNGWNNVLVTVSFTCSDALSGVFSLSSPTMLGEGASQSVTGTCADLAGNSVSATESGINIDLTVPVITGSRSVGPNTNGWNNVPVTVSFSCSDALSGVLDISSPTTLGEGASQSVTGTCTDKAGNAASNTVAPVNIDLTPPIITGSTTPGPNINGWNNIAVTVTFACTDALSGVSASSGPTTLGEGSGQVVTGMCSDRAGNSASATVANINVDLTPPAISGSRTPPANANGWNNADVVVTFTCSDSLSGVAVPPVTPQTVSSEAAAQSRSASCVDKAGNSASATVSGISIDKTLPTLSASRSPLANVFGWNNVSVTVTFACSDSLSGVASYSSPTTLSGEGAGQSVTGTCQDKAGNVAYASIGSGINIDKTPPQTNISIGTPRYISGATTYVSLGTPFSLSATDSLSGVYQTKYGIDDPNTMTVYVGAFTMPSKGTHTVYFRSVDKALNVETTNFLTVVIGASTISYTGSTQAQYSDAATVQALLIEVASQQPLSGKVISFTIGSQSASSSTDGTGKAISTIVLTQVACTCTVTASFAGDAGFLQSSASTSFNILKEDASISYTGDTVVPTTSSFITLRATVQDSQDGFLGDLTRAQVTFRIYASDNAQTLLQTVGPIPVSLTSVAGVGTATVQIPNMQENTYIVIVSLDPGANQYYFAPSSDPAALTVYQPTGSYVTGGGWIVDSSGSHGNFGFVVRYTKSGQIQGHSVYVYRVGGYDYLIKSNSWIGFAVVGNHAYFQGKATLQIYDPSTGLTVFSDGNYQFRVDVWDNTGTSTNGGIDTYQIIVWDKNGLVYHQASGSLIGGQIMVHDASKP